MAQRQQVATRKFFFSLAAPLKGSKKKRDCGRTEGEKRKYMNI